MSAASKKQVPQIAAQAYIRVKDAATGKLHSGYFQATSPPSLKSLHDNDVTNPSRCNFSSDTKLLPPIEPIQIIGIGLNYRKHATETGLPIPKHPIVFMKPLNTIQSHLGPIRLPHPVVDFDEVDYEGELAVIIDRPCRHVSVENALSYVRGYTVANDVSARRWQGKKGGGQWVFAKSFDTFTPIGPGIVSGANIDPQNLKLTTMLNDQIVQESNTSDMIFSVAEIISFLSKGMTLLPGTVILTGTPEGVGYTRKPTKLYLKDGDVVTVSIENIGTLENPVVVENVPATALVSKI